MIKVKFTRDEKLLTDECNSGLVSAMIAYALFCVVVTCIGLVLLLAHMDKVVSIVFICLGVVLFTALTLASLLSRKSRLKKQLAKGTFDEAEITFGDNVVYRVADSEKTFEYKDFYKLRREDSYLFLYLNKYEFVTVPKSACDDCAALEEFLRERIGNARV